MQKTILGREDIKNKPHFNLTKSLKQKSHTKYAILKRTNVNKTIELESITKREIEPWEVEEEIEHIVTFKIKR